MTFAPCSLLAQDQGVDLWHPFVCPYSSSFCQDVLLSYSKVSGVLRMHASWNYEHVLREWRPNSSAASFRVSLQASYKWTADTFCLNRLLAQCCFVSKVKWEYGSIKNLIYMLLVFRIRLKPFIGNLKRGHYRPVASCSGDVHLMREKNITVGYV